MPSHELNPLRGCWLSAALAIAVIVLPEVSAAGGPELRLVKNISRVTDLRASSQPGGFARVGDRVLFSAYDREHGRELWVTDGTPAGTRILADLNPGPEGTQFHSWVVQRSAAMGEVLYVRISSMQDRSAMRILRSDGTAEGTFVLADRVGRYLAASATHVFFDFERSLWSSDGTTEGSKAMLWAEDLGEIGLSLMDSWAYATDRGVYFLIRDWMSNLSEEVIGFSDGTAAGTKVLRYPGMPVLTTHAGPPHSVWLERVNATVGGDKLYFVGFDEMHGAELWSSDGTPEGTRIVIDLFPGPESPFPRDTTFGSIEPQLVWYEGHLYFVASPDGQKFCLWRSDGTADGTVPIYDLYPSAEMAGADCHRDLYQCEYRLWVMSFELQIQIGWRDFSRRVRWRSDGTTKGTEVVFAVGDPLDPGRHNDPGEPYLPWAMIGDELFFHRIVSLPSGALEKHLVRASDGLELLDGPNSLPTALGRGVVFARGEGDFGGEPWWSDGTPGGTFLLRDIFAPEAGSGPANLFDLDGVLIFVADDGVYGREVWRSAGDEASTALVHDIFAGSGSSDPSHFVRKGDFLYFTADDGVHGRQLWRTRGRSSDTERLTAVHTGAGGMSLQVGPEAFRTIYLVIDDGEHGREIWRYRDDEGLALVKDIHPGRADSQRSYCKLDAVLPDGRLLFVAEDDERGFQVWITDGSEANTVRLTDSEPETFYGCLSHSSIDGDRIVFRTEPFRWWMTDGTPQGTVEIPQPDQFFAVGGRNYVTRRHGNHRTKLFVKGQMPDGEEREVEVTREHSLHYVVGTADHLFFSGVHDRDPTRAVALYRTDGRTPPVLVSRLASHGLDPSSRSLELRRIGEWLFIDESRDSWRHKLLWVSDGSEAGTHFLGEVTPDADRGYYLDYQPDWMTHSGDRVYLVADIQQYGRELWAVDTNALAPLCSQGCPAAPTWTSTATPTISPTPSPVPTSSPTHSRTPTWAILPSWTPTARATPTPVYDPCTDPLIRASCPAVVVAPIGAVSGGAIELGVSFRANGKELVALQFDLEFPPQIEVQRRASGAPDCRVDAGLEKPGSRLAWHGDGDAAVRVMILSLEEQLPIRDGAMLVRCAAQVRAHTSCESALVGASRVRGSDARGTGVPMAVEPGLVWISDREDGSTCDDPRPPRTVEADSQPEPLDEVAEAAVPVEAAEPVTPVESVESVDADVDLAPVEAAAAAPARPVASGCHVSGASPSRSGGLGVVVAFWVLLVAACARRRAVEPTRNRAR